MISPPRDLCECSIMVTGVRCAVPLEQKVTPSTADLLIPAFSNFWAQTTDSLCFFFFLPPVSLSHTNLPDQSQQPTAATHIFKRLSLSLSQL